MKISYIVTAVDLVQNITEELSQNDHHEDALERHFAPDFTYWTNGEVDDLAKLASRLVKYWNTCEYLEISHQDMIFPTDKAIIVSYIWHPALTSKTQNI